MAKQPKSIQVIPSDNDVDEKVDQIAKELRTSRGGVAGLALDYFVPRLKNGQISVRLMGGKICFEDNQAA